MLLYFLGTRYHSRGTNIKGNVSNYVETEQIITTTDGAIGSFVGIRGSIPIFWRQRVNLRYQPKFEISTSLHTSATFQRHFDQLLQRYNRVFAVNLVNSHGNESKLAKEFQYLIANLDVKRGQVSYLHFDFHQECAHNNWDRLSILLKKLKDPIEDYGYFLKSNGKSGKLQTGIFRTNCIDCLDRTNVAQGIFANYTLTQILRDLQIFGTLETIESQHDLYNVFRQIWADNADALSHHYAGTKAQKTDFTRTGKRSLFGLFRDLEKSAIRYIKANFSDGYRQVQYWSLYFILYLVTILSLG